MADTQDPSIGWGGKIKIHNGTTLYELKNVVSFQPPPYTRTRQDASHLNSPGRRPQTLPGLYESNECKGTMHYRSGSDTDVLMRAAVDAGNKRACEMTIPLAGEPSQVLSTQVIITSYEPPEIEAGAIMMATFSMTVEDAVTQAPAV